MNPPRLASARAATQHQKRWFADVAADARRGDPIALVNADAPHEILRALAIPYVVNQWWASIISAKQMGPQSLEQLKKQGYPDFSLQYDAIPLGEQLLLEDRPWGGLPQPAFAIAERSGDVTQKIFELWGEREGTETYLLSRTGADPAPDNWWESVTHDAEQVFGSDRIDLLQSEIEELVPWLEERTGRQFDRHRFTEIMALANEQATWNRRTRDLLAQARPAPVHINEIIPAVMIPQWHRGTQWAVDSAKALHDEVGERIESGMSVFPNERRRLMWIGRGLWNDTSLYSRFAEQYGAVFVWSMYLAIAADGYERVHDDPFRALAQRFVGLTDLLYVPPMSSSWYVKEARLHGIDGVVHLVADDTPGGAFITEALEEAGFPVLEIRANNADARSTAAANIPEQISSFIQDRVPAPA